MLKLPSIHKCILEFVVCPILERCWLLSEVLLRLSMFLFFNWRLCIWSGSFYVEAIFINWFIFRHRFCWECEFLLNFILGRSRSIRHTLYLLWWVALSERFKFRRSQLCDWISMRFVHGDRASVVSCRNWRQLCPRTITLQDACTRTMSHAWRWSEQPEIHLCYQSQLRFFGDILHVLPRLHVLLIVAGLLQMSLTVLELGKQHLVFFINSFVFLLSCSIIQWTDCDCFGLLFLLEGRWTAVTFRSTFLEVNRLHPIHQLLIILTQYNVPSYKSDSCL